MKKYRLLSLLFLPLFFVSCDSWLDVKPEDEIDEKDLFSTGAGYRHSLNGIYFGMGDQSLYGGNLTWTTVDALAQCYVYNDSKSDDTGYMNYGASQYNWDQYQLKPRIETMWENAYKIVANCNNLIQNIVNEDPDKFAYKEREKKMIWGEALAIRASIQFDMLRLFAAAPSTNPGNKTYIPYISEYPSYVSKRLTVDSCLNNIIRDLEESRELLWKVDSGRSFTYSNRFETNTLRDEFFVNYKRGYRLNYYAATAILARACLYAHKTDKAYTYAKEIIDVQKEKNYFRYYTSNISRGDIKFYSDIIYGLESVDLIEYIDAVNQLGNPDPWYQYYLKVLNLKSSFFGNDVSSSGSCNDNRYKYWVYDVGNGSDYRFTKYEKYDAENNTAAKISNYLVPLVRMSELYYIAAEVVYKRNMEEAKEYLRTVKSGRGLRATDASMVELENASEDNFMDVLINDARREWLGEGQIFFMYKRLNKMIPGASGVLIPTDEKTILPVPATETNLNK
jgi:hypothetical protein